MLKKILHTIFLPCSEATLLMEKRNSQMISSTENRRLNLHIAICKWCKVYNEKFKLLDQIFQKTLAEKETEMSEAEIQDFKNKIIEKLDF